MKKNSNKNIIVNPGQKQTGPLSNIAINDQTRQNTHATPQKSMEQMQSSPNNH